MDEVGRAREGAGEAWKEAYALDGNCATYRAAEAIIALTDHALGRPSESPVPVGEIIYRAGSPGAALPRSRAAGILLLARDTGRVLLLLRSSRSSHPLTWAPPGGTLDHGETPFEGAVRETREETGFEIAPLDIVPLHALRAPGQFTFYTFLAVVPWEAMPALSDESEAWAWVDPLRGIRSLHPGVAAMLKDPAVRERLGEYAVPLWKRVLGL
jgi:8-oxo-dGTP pyrophosphatase MutT (NUDIX family)